ncbi:MAG: hypothetical protein ABL876_16435 [Chitinophagaceae bacterium]
MKHSTSGHIRPQNPSRFFTFVIAVISICMLVSCQPTTLLHANFTNDQVGSPPAAAQPVGTVTVNAGAGAINVVNAPNVQLPSTNWTLISHPSRMSEETKLEANCTQVSYTGRYSILTSLYIPARQGPVFVGLYEALSFAPGKLFVLEFNPEKNVRIDEDNALVFGHYPTDTIFLLSIDLHVTDIGANAVIELKGTGASGSKTFVVPASRMLAAHRFGKLKFNVYEGNPSSFFVDNIIVTRKN